MKHDSSRNHGGMRAAGCIAALGLAFTIALPHTAHADDIAPPNVPDKIQVLAPNEVFLIGHATGSQNYVCVPSGTGVDWSLFTPEATLFNDTIQQVTTHFFSPNPNPDDRGAIRATWESSRTRVRCGPPPPTWQRLRPIQRSYGPMRLPGCAWRLSVSSRDQMAETG